MTPNTSTAAQIAAAVRSGELTAASVVEAALDRLAAAEPRIGACTEVPGDAARRAADRIDRLTDESRGTLPLAGVPVAIKESIPADAPVVRRLVDAGAVVVARTTIPEQCVWGMTDSGDFGVTRNPWDPALTPGGSSGGSAAIVAAGVVPLALGSDGMGSLRIPAACCGITAIKPGDGLVPHVPGEDTWGEMAENGPMARSVEDLAIAMDVLTDGAVPLEGTASGSYSVGWSTSEPIEMPGPALVSLQEPWKSAVSTAVRVLESRGSRLAEVKVPAPAYPLLLLARWTKAVADAAHHANLPLSQMERRTKYHALLGRTVFRRGGADSGNTGYNRATTKLRAAVEELMTSRGLDLLLIPALADFPPEATDWHLRSWFRNLWACLRYAPYTSQWNLLGWPAMSVPVGTTTGPNGVDVPVSVQLVARPGGEATLLAAARLLEDSNPWQAVAPDFE